MEGRQSIVVGEYLHLIYRIQGMGRVVKACTLVQRLASSPSTVHATLRRLERDGLVILNDRREIELTEEGKENAAGIARRHNLAEYFLWHELKIPWYLVHTHASSLEHAITPLVAERLDEYLSYPKFCPHGSPMPGVEHPHTSLLTLRDVTTGTKIEVVMLDESMEEEEDLLKYLQNCLVMPGQQHIVKERIDVARTLVLQSENGLTNLPYDIASLIDVREICDY
jgi:DtxR family Mn-dependent transcriptional regulator